jgi:AAA family ATP:ADP antiporter
VNGGTAETAPALAGPLDRFLGLFSDVHPGEGARAFLMLVNVFLILVCYYIIKTVREPLILTAEVPESLQGLGIGPAEVKTYAAAGQALVLMGFVPAYSWFASRVDRMKLVLGVTAFFVANIVLFAVGVQVRVDHIGVFFYVWVGIFSLSIIFFFFS